MPEIGHVRPGISRHNIRRGSDVRTRAIDKVASLADRSTDLVTFWRSCTEVISTVVPHYWAPCFFTFDPASLLVTSHFHEGLDEFPPMLSRASTTATTCTSWSSRAVPGRGVDHPRGGRRRSERQPALAVQHGDGRRPGDDRPPAHPSGRDLGGGQPVSRARRRQFADSDKEFFRAIGPHLAAGARRAMTFGEAMDPEIPDGPGLVVIDSEWQVRSATAGAEHWMSRLPDGDVPTAGCRRRCCRWRLRACGSRGDDPRPWPSRACWPPTAPGCCCTGHPGGRGPAQGRRDHRARAAGSDLPLLMSAYELTEREREIVALVLAGASTTEMPMPSSSHR